MKPNKTFLLSFCTLLFCITSAQKVTELHYSAIATKTNKAMGGFDFWFGKNFLKIQTTPAHDRNPARYIDKPNKLLVMDFENRKQFIVEELDSVYELNAELVKDGEKQVINGYNCEKYYYREKVTFGVSTANSALSITPTSKTVDYDLSIWITNDLQADADYSAYIAHTLFGSVATFTFDGVIVKMESNTPAKKSKYDGFTVLEKAVTNTELEKDFARPWKKYEKPVALLPFENANSYAIIMNYTNEKTTDQYKRMKALLIKVTGIEKPEWKSGFEGIVF